MTDEAAEPQDISAIVPTRLAVHGQIDIQAFLAQPLLALSSDVSAEWQCLSGSAPFWEMGATTHGVRRDRMTEVVGLTAAAGEQLALARAALVECELWRAQRSVVGTKSGDEMCHRAMTELLSHFCLGLGHSLANLTGRILALDDRLHGRFIDEFSTVLPPHSSERSDWLSCDYGTARKLRKIAKAASWPEAHKVPDAITQLLSSGDWHALVARRATDYHRRRPQSDGVVGVPLRSLWKPLDGGGYSLSGGLATHDYDDGRQLAADNSRLGSAALSESVVAMGTLWASLHEVRRVIFDGSWSS